jgi:translation elongation factor EF-Ts
MYNTKVECTYNTPEVFLETDNITDDEKSFIRNIIYRQELLNVLDIDYENNDEDNEEKISEAIKDLYNRVKDSNCLRKCMVKVVQKHMNVGKYMTSDEELGMMLLFSYDYMYLTHICISEFIETGNIDDENIRKLVNILF